MSTTTPSKSNRSALSGKTGSLPTSSLLLEDGNESLVHEEEAEDAFWAEDGDDMTLEMVTDINEGQVDEEV
jgi:hypothetical protein